MEKLISTIEIMLDNEVMRNIKESKKQIKKGNFVECTIDELGFALK